MTTELAVLAKYWQPGRVKTRLARSLGNEPAARLYHAMLHATVCRMEDVSDRRTLAYTPNDRCDKFAQWAPPQWHLEPQVDGNLGDRMRQVMMSALGRGSGQVVLLGSDSPTVPVEYVREAFEMLRRLPVVLGPTFDGGYYLVGAAVHGPDIFDDISWSTDSVWEQTLVRLADAGCPFGQLPPWYDVDDTDSLSRLVQDLASSDRRCGAYDILRSRCREITDRA